MNESELRTRYEYRLQAWRDAEEAFEDGGTMQQSKDLAIAEAQHDVAAKALIDAGYILEAK